MAITVNTDSLAAYRTNAGQTEGNEVIYKLDAGSTYVFEAIVTSAGTATMKGSTTTIQPTDFSSMAEVQDGTKAANFIRVFEGASYAGLDIASSSGGTWTTIVRKA